MKRPLRSAITRWLLLGWALCFPRNWSRRRRRYPQTWSVLPLYTLRLNLFPSCFHRWTCIEVDLQNGTTGYQYRKGWRTFWMITEWITSPRWSKTRRFYEWACGRLIGHELSATEHGYGGGTTVDRWCRWCNKLIPIPKAESIWAEKNSDFLDQVGKEFPF